VSKKIIVPEGMLKAVNAAFDSGKRKPVELLEAALRWLSENPVVPTRGQLHDIMGQRFYYEDHIIKGIIEWQRRMFLAPEEEIPKELKALMFGELAPAKVGPINKEMVNALVLEAYRLGQQSITAERDAK